MRQNPHVRISGRHRLRLVGALWGARVSNDPATRPPNAQSVGSTAGDPYVHSSPVERG